jgi:cholesterol transport system auxiliary component
MKAVFTLIAVLLLAGCSGLLPKAPPPPAFYTLDASPPAAARPPAARVASLPTLLVQSPQAAGGFDSTRIVYIRQPQRLEYFAHSEWVDTPARLLAPLIVGALQRSAAFGAVLAAPAAASGDLRLDTEILRLQQEFGTGAPSQVRFTLRATLVDTASRRVLGWREFDTTVAAASDDPYGGVVAARGAVQDVLAALAQFCSDAVQRR